MLKRRLVRTACVCVVLATTSTSLPAQSGRIHNRRVPLNDLSREEKQLSNSAPGETNTRAGIDSRPHSAAQTTLKDESVKPSRQETKRIQAQRWTDEDVVSVIIVTALVLIVFVGLKRT